MPPRLAGPTIYSIAAATWFGSLGSGCDSFPLQPFSTISPITKRLARRRVILNCFVLPFILSPFRESPRIQRDTNSLRYHKIRSDISHFKRLAAQPNIPITSLYHDLPQIATNCNLFYQACAQSHPISISSFRSYCGPDGQDSHRKQGAMYRTNSDGHLNFFRAFACSTRQRHL
jgi:hypothetical protein